MPDDLIEPAKAEPSWIASRSWLYRHEYISIVGTPGPRKVLALLGLPNSRVSRPRDWGMTREAIERVLDPADA